MDPVSAAKPVLCLASQSPRRRALLAQIAVAHIVRPAHIDEATQAGEEPLSYVERIAHAKAQSVWPHAQPLPVLAADTIVVLDGVTYGKPRDRAHGLAMLAQLCGREHLVLTAVALAARGAVHRRVSSSTVRLRATNSAERAAYWDSGEPADKAGGYAIQGLGAVLVESLQGSYSGVMGLPLYETAQLLDAAGVPYAWGAGARA
jgi:septum formation protein